MIFQDQIFTEQIMDRLNLCHLWYLMEEVPLKSLEDYVGKSPYKTLIYLSMVSDFNEVANMYEPAMNLNNFKTIVKNYIMNLN